MPIFLPKEVNGVPNKRVILFSSEEGPWKGIATDVEPKRLAVNQPLWLAGMEPHNNGSVLRPSPGQRPLTTGYSLRHDGIWGFDARTLFSGMSVWALTNAPGSTTILALMNHQSWEPGTANPHAYPNEIVLITGAPSGLRARCYNNATPLIPRESDYDFDLTPQVGGILRASARASWTTWQATANTPVLQVLATDTNWTVAIGASSNEIGLETRRLGLNAPQSDIFNVPATALDDKTPIGPQIPARLLSGSAGTGPAEFTTDPDAVWGLVDGSVVELDMGFPPAYNGFDINPDSRVFAILPASDGGTITTASLRFTGSWTDQETRQISESTGSDDPVDVTALTTFTDANGDAALQYLYTQPDTTYVSEHHYRFNEENSSGIYHPRVTVVNAGTATFTRALFHRAGNQIRRDGAVSRWHSAYQWERRDGSYLIRGGHSGTTKRFTTEAAGTNSGVESGSQISFRGLAASPLDHEVPTHVNLLLRAYNVGVRARAGAAIGSQDLDESGGVAAGFTVVLSVPIHDTDGGWKTNTGFPAHDIELQKAVFWNWLDDRDIGSSNDVVPGGLKSVGGFAGVASMGPHLVLWDAPRLNLKSVTIFKRAREGFGHLDTILSSDVDDFHDWFVGREIVFGGKSYTVWRVLQEQASVGSELLLVDVALPPEGERTGSAYVKEDQSNLWFCMGGNEYGEVTSINWSIAVPDGEEISKFRAVGEDGGVVYTKEGRAYEIILGPERYDIYREAVPPLTYRMALASSGGGAAGLHGVAEAEGATFKSTTRGIDVAVTETNSASLTGAENGRFFLELADPARATDRNLVYDAEKQALLLSNIASFEQTFPGIREYGAMWNMRNGGAMSLLFPWLGRAAGVAALPSPQSTVANKRRLTRTQWRPGPIVMFVDVATVGTAPISGVTQAGPHVVVYDTKANVWSGVYVGVENAGGDDYFVPHDTTKMEPTAGDRTRPAPGTHSATQTADGKIVCCFGYSPRFGDSPEPTGQSAWTIRLERQFDGTWALEEGEGCPQTGQFAHVFAMAPARDGSYYALRRLVPEVDERMAIAHYDTDSVVWPYRPGVGGRQAQIEGAAFEWESSTANNRCRHALVAGSSGELYVFGYTYSASVGAAVMGEENAGNGTVTGIAVEADAPQEVWTFECTDASTPESEVFSATGSVSGAQAAATVGVPYDNDIIALTINDGAANWEVGDTFQVHRLLSGVVTIRRIDPETLQPFGKDGTVALTNPGSPNNAGWGTGDAPLGPIAFQANRHGEVWFTERTATPGEVTLHRYRFAKPGYAAATTGAQTALSDIESLATPSGRITLMIDQRQQTWCAVDEDVGSGRLGFKVFQFGEGDDPIVDPITIHREGYNRFLVSLVQAGNSAWYLVRDEGLDSEPTEWRLIKAIGAGQVIGGSHPGDGTADIRSVGGTTQEEDSDEHSIFFDLASVIAGVGGTITYAACDTQADRGTAQTCQANATAMLGHFGMGAI